MVCVRVRLGGGLARLAAAPRLSIELREGATVTDLCATLAEREPRLAPALPGALTVIGGEQAERSRTLAAGEEVAFLIPVAGGAG
jgi:molybdopterin converting factor small subunit